VITEQPVFRARRQIEIADDDNRVGIRSANRTGELVQHRPPLTERVRRQIHVVPGHAIMPDFVPALAVFDDPGAGVFLRDPA
jgi:hypothetical protein